MALKWFDGAELWSAGGYWNAAYLAGSMASTTTFRVSPGTRSMSYNAGFLQTPSLGALQNTWFVGFGLRISAQTSAMFEWRVYSASTVQCFLRAIISGAGFKLELVRGSTIIATTSAVYSLNAWNYFELKVVVRTGTNGSYELRANTVSQFSGSGVNLANGGADGADAHSFGHNSGGNDNFLDDIYICDDTGSANNNFLGDKVCVHVLPSADGASSTWSTSTGSNHAALVDDPNTAPNDSDYIHSDTNGNKDLFEFSDLPATGIGTINGIMLSLRASMEATGSRVLRPKFRNSGGTEAACGADQTINSTIVTEHPVFVEQNPVSAAAWTKSDIDGGQFGVEVIS